MLEGIRHSWQTKQREAQTRGDVGGKSNFQRRGIVLVYICVRFIYLAPECVHWGSSSGTLKLYNALVVKVCSNPKRCSALNWNRAFLLCSCSNNSREMKHRNLSFCLSISLPSLFWWLIHLYRHLKPCQKLYLNVYVNYYVWTNYSANTQC